MTDPADVPTITSASSARQPVSDSNASSAPISHDAPTTPPAPRTNPTRMRSADLTFLFQAKPSPRPPQRGPDRVCSCENPTHSLNLESAFSRTLGSGLVLGSDGSGDGQAAAGA